MGLVPKLGVLLDLRLKPNWEFPPTLPVEDAVWVVRAAIVGEPAQVAQVSVLPLTDMLYPDVALDAAAMTDVPVLVLDVEKVPKLTLVPATVVQSWPVIEVPTQKVSDSSIVPDKVMAWAVLAATVPVSVGPVLKLEPV